MKLTKTQQEAYEAIRLDRDANNGHQFSRHSFGRTYRFETFEALERVGLIKCVSVQGSMTASSIASAGFSRVYTIA